MRLAVQILHCRFIAGVLALAVGTSLFGSPALGQRRIDRERLESFINPYLDSQTVMGLSLGVYQQGVTSTYGFGHVRENSTDLPNGDTLYEIGSITKVFTGLLLADAVERKIMQLDQPIVDHFPSAFARPNPALNKITLKHLATHSSGLPRMPTNLDLTRIENPYIDYDAADLFSFLNEYQPTRSPEKQYEYSNLGVGLLGYLIAHRQNSDYESLLRERIFLPLKMTDTAITLTPELRSRLAQGYDADGSDRGPWDFSVLASAGAIRSTANDLLKFAGAMLHPNKKMQPWIDNAWLVHQPPIAKTDLAMGLNWLIARDGHTRFHNGQTGGYHAALFVCRKLDLAVILLSNTATGEIDRLAEDIFKLYAGDDVQPRAFDAIVEVPGELLKRYEGVYQLVEGVDFTVTVVNGKLMVGLTGQQTVRVYPKSETEFEYKIVKAEITFHPDKQGQWNELILLQNGIRQRAIRKPISGEP